MSFGSNLIGVLDALTSNLTTHLDFSPDTEVLTDNIGKRSSGNVIAGCCYCNKTRVMLLTYSSYMTDVKFESSLNNRIALFRKNEEGRLNAVAKGTQ